jgi:Domain of unknown function (DUF4276)
MSEIIRITAIVEGSTEKNFIDKVLQPYLNKQNIFITSILASKAGQKGGDIKFTRIKKDIEIHLKQSSDTYITLMIDFYGIAEWKNLDQAKQKNSPSDKANIINQSIQEEIEKLLPEYNSKKRFIPYVNVHEFEALLFSDIEILSKHLNVDKKQIEQIIKECGEPERINDSRKTAPSKRLDSLSNNRFRKTGTGVEIAKEIGIFKMREACPLFDTWLNNIEELVERGEK